MKVNSVSYVRCIHKTDDELERGNWGVPASFFFFRLCTLLSVKVLTVRLGCFLLESLIVMIK